MDEPEVVCPHEELEPNGTCVACGAFIEEVEPEIEYDQEFLDKVMAAITSLGDAKTIMAIAQYAKETAMALKKMVENNTDPANPALPKFRLVGTRVERLSHKFLLHELALVTYGTAQDKGYRGTLEFWEMNIRESAEFSTDFM